MHAVTESNTCYTHIFNRFTDRLGISIGFIFSSMLMFSHGRIYCSKVKCVSQSAHCHTVCHDNAIIISIFYSVSSFIHVIFVIKTKYRHSVCMIFFFLIYDKCNIFFNKFVNLFCIWLNYFLSRLLKIGGKFASSDLCRRYHGEP